MTNLLKNDESTCWKPWEGSTGKAHNQCCCNCKNHFKLFSHPWVDHKPITNQVGYVCSLDIESLVTNVVDNDDRGMILSNEHGLCECWEAKPSNNIEKEKQNENG